LRYGILHNDGYVVVTGNVGTGKTTLATALLMDLSDRIVAGTVSLFDVGGLDFLNLIALAYGLSNTFQSKTTFMAHFMRARR
jgi:general secretion pathway protein A